MFQHTLAAQREIGHVRKQDDDVTQTDRCPQQLSRFNSVSAAISRVFDRSLLSVRTLRSILGRGRQQRRGVYCRMERRQQAVGLQLEKNGGDVCEFAAESTARGSCHTAVSAFIANWT